MLEQAWNNYVGIHLAEIKNKLIEDGFSRKLKRAGRIEANSTVVMTFHLMLVI